MGRFGKAIIGTIKKIVGSSSKHSCASSSSCYTEHEESLMHEDEETVLTEEQEEEQGRSMEEDDKHYLDLDRGREMEAYHLIKDRDFEPPPLYDSGFSKP